ncbi:hypothetical protein EDD21DRAFT_74627 [Dissophora ornata]|nr:hypothetical protein EDD21DRAFT_74627 [Dissophora ornata]
MPTAVDETTPLWPQGAVHNTDHLGELHPEDDQNDEVETTHTVPRYSTVEHGPPADPWRISYWIMAFQGASMLLPWNGNNPHFTQKNKKHAGETWGRHKLTVSLFMYHACLVFITAQGFFKLRFTGSPYEDNFQNYFSIAFMGTNLLVVGSSILIQKQVGQQRIRFVCFKIWWMRAKTQIRVRALVQKSTAPLLFFSFLFYPLGRSA